MESVTEKRRGEGVGEKLNAENGQSMVPTAKPRNKKLS